MPNYFKTLTRSDIFVDTARLTTGIFANGAGNLAGTSMFTSSLSGSSNKRYFYTIKDAAGATGVDRFSITYGNFHGSGSDITTGSTSLMETQAIYKQWSNILQSDVHQKFTFHHATSSKSYIQDDDIYILSADSDVVKDSLDTKFTLNLNAWDSASVAKNLQLTTSEVNRWSDKGGIYFVIVSGSGGTAASGDLTGYGKFYPQQSAIVLSGTRLSASLMGPSGSAGASGSQVSDGPIFGLAPDHRTSVRTYVNDSQTAGADNAFKFYRSLQSGSVTLRTVNELNQTIYYCRAHHDLFNWSSNPTYIQSGSITKDVLSVMTGDPVTYVTTVGLLNQQDQVMAVAKINQPQKKNHSKEIVFAVTIDG